MTQFSPMTHPKGKKINLRRNIKCQAPGAEISHELQQTTSRRLSFSGNHASSATIW